MRKIGKQEIEDIATGAAVLGTGGGGDPYLGKLMALQAVEEFGPVDVISVDEIDDDALVVSSAGLGAPVCIFEKPPNGQEILGSFKSLESYLGQEIAATMPIEAGGLNSLIPIALAANIGLPVIDVDGIGRAFPEIQLTTFYLDGISASPMSIADEKGNVTLFNTIDNVWAENFARITSVEMGSSAMMAIYPMSGKSVRESGIRDILTFAENIGQSTRLAKQNGFNPVEQVLKTTEGFKLFEGKITDVNRRTEGGWVKGTATIEGLYEDKGEQLRLEFQNENLIARTDETLLCIVPDLITVLDSETGSAITTEGLRYGARCMVIGIPCHPKWRTEDGIKKAGPAHFNYDVSYQPVEKLAGKEVLG